MWLLSMLFLKLLLDHYLGHSIHSPLSLAAEKETMLVDAMANVMDSMKATKMVLLMVILSDL